MVKLRRVTQLNHEHRRKVVRSWDAETQSQGCPMVFPGRAEGPQLDLPEHWLSSEAKNLIERMVVKAPSWDRENSHFSSLGVFFSLTDSVFSLLKPRATTRSWKIRMPARDWVVVIFMNWRRILGSINHKSQDFCAAKHLEATQNTERSMPNCSLVHTCSGNMSNRCTRRFWIAWRGASFLWHHLRRSKTSKQKMWKFGNLTRWQKMIQWQKSMNHNASVKKINNKKFWTVMTDDLERCSKPICSCTDFGGWKYLAIRFSIGEDEKITWGRNSMNQCGIRLETQGRHKIS